MAPRHQPRRRASPTRFLSPQATGRCKPFRIRQLARAAAPAAHLREQFPNRRAASERHYRKHEVAKQCIVARRRAGFLTHRAPAMAATAARVHPLPPRTGSRRTCSHTFPHRSRPSSTCFRSAVAAVVRRPVRREPSAVVHGATPGKRQRAASASERRREGYPPAGASPRSGLDRVARPRSGVPK